MKKTRTLSVALTWDGARWPVRKLSPKARAFLGGKGSVSAGEMAEWAACDTVKEIRVCWVPQLAGGDDVLALPFVTPTAKRIPFRMVCMLPLGDALGVVYRR